MISKKNSSYFVVPEPSKQSEATTARPPASVVDSKGGVAKEDKDSPTLNGGTSVLPESPLVALTAGLKSLHTRRALMGFMSGKAVLGKGGKGKVPKTLALPICAQYTLQTTTGGVLQTKFGGTLLASNSEFGDLSGIFELCRVVGFRIHYEPYSYGAGLDDAAVGHDLFHRPCVAVLDPDIPAASTNAFTTLATTVIPSDPNVSVFNTSQPHRKTFKAPPLSVYASGSTATEVSMFVWQAPAGMTNAIGGLCWAAATDAASGTNGINGYMWVEYLTEWKFRQ